MSGGVLTANDRNQDVGVQSQTRKLKDPDLVASSGQRAYFKFMLQYSFWFFFYRNLLAQHGHLLTSGHAL